VTSSEIDAEDVLTALCIDAQANPETFNGESLRSALEASDMLDIWEDAKAAGEDDEDEDEDATTDDDEEDVEEGGGDEETE